jgi:hypothetical protein
MQLYFKPPIGSSILDVCLNVYLSLNLLPKLITDNSIQSLNYVSGINDVYVYDTDLIYDEFLHDSVIRNDMKFCTGDLKKNNASFVSENYLLIESGEILQSEASDDFIL